MSQFSSCTLGVRLDSEVICIVGKLDLLEIRPPGLSMAIQRSMVPKGLKDFSRKIIFSLYSTYFITCKEQLKSFFPTKSTVARLIDLLSELKHLSTVIMTLIKSYNSMSVIVETYINILRYYLFNQYFTAWPPLYYGGSVIDYITM